MQFFGRRIIHTTLDPIPRSFRCVPGVLALNQLEIDALSQGNGDKFKEIAEIVHAEDMAEAMCIYKHKPRKVTSKTPKLAPSTRMAMLNAIYKR